VSARSLAALVAIAACLTAVFATAAAAPSQPSPLAPVSRSRPSLERNGAASDEIQLSLPAWSSPRSVFHLGFSWLVCDLSGKNCSTLPDAHTASIIPPQELRIVTLRGVVTATNRFGSRSVVTRNFFYDMAGIPFTDWRFVRRHSQYDPTQLRAWYGLRADENGAGQTIVIPDFGRALGLREAVDHFSTHYGLPTICRPSHSRGCFDLVISSAGKRPTDVNRSGEAEGDIEWVHAIAPQARILFLQFDHAAALFDKVGRLWHEGRASVMSDSWCDPCHRHRGFGLHVVYPRVAESCGLPHLVCVQASGDHGSPGDTPSNSPDVLAVGGTIFELVDGAPRAELPWQDSGSGDTDNPLPRPAWQRRLDAGCGHVGGPFSCAKRVVPDVSATAVSVPVFQPNKPRFGWYVFGGTSLSAPLWAAVIALADQQLQRDGQRPIGIYELHEVLYHGDLSAGLDDVEPQGWDWTTGWGSPRAGIVDVLMHAIEQYRARH
jgi:hypothetical protein